MSDRLDASQSYEDNRDAFVERLIEAGWQRKEAVEEWIRIQQGVYDE